MQSPADCTILASSFSMFIHSVPYYIGVEKERQSLCMSPCAVTSAQRVRDLLALRVLLPLASFLWRSGLVRHSWEKPDRRCNGVS